MDEYFGIYYTNPDEYLAIYYTNPDESWKWLWSHRYEQVISDRITGYRITL